MAHPAGHIDPADLLPDIAAYRAGNDAAGDRLCRCMRPAVRLGVARMLGDDDPDVDDVVQESLIACLGYLTGDREFSGDPTRLAVTIARNRCRDLLRHRLRRPHLAIEPFATWLADPGRSPLDDLTERELSEMLQSALARLTRSCRDLLRALYVEDRTPEQVRARIGLGTVQAVYHRRGVCLGQAKKFLQRQWRFGSGGDGTTGQDRGEEPKGRAYD